MTDVPRDYPFGRAAGEGMELLPVGQAEQEREDTEQRALSVMRDVCDENARLRSELEAAREIVKRALQKIENEHSEECCVYSDDHDSDCFISVARTFLGGS